MSGGAPARGGGIGRRALLRGAWRPRSPAAPAVVRPPGAVAAGRFDETCDGCAECAAACPAAAIVMTGPATALAANSPQIRAEAAPCVMCDGLVCSTVCPVGALEISLPTTMRIAAVAFRADACWAATGLDPGCDDCFDRCPLKGEAITYRRGAGPTVHADHCTGCGVCVHSCPSRPKALSLTAL